MNARTCVATKKADSQDEHSVLARGPLHRGCCSPREADPQRGYNAIAPL